MANELAEAMRQLRELARQGKVSAEALAELEAATLQGSAVRFDAERNSELAQLCARVARGEDKDVEGFWQKARALVDEPVRQGSPETEQALADLRATQGAQSQLRQQAQEKLLALKTSAEQAIRERDARIRTLTLEVQQLRVTCTAQRKTIEVLQQLDLQPVDSESGR